MTVFELTKTIRNLLLHAGVRPDCTLIHRSGRRTGYFDLTFNDYDTFRITVENLEDIPEVQK